MTSKSDPSKTHADRRSQQNLLFAKALFFTANLSSVGWTRYQNNFYLDEGLTPLQIGRYPVHAVDT